MTIWWDIGRMGWLGGLLLHLQTSVDITTNLKATSPSIHNFMPHVCCILDKCTIKFYFCFNSAVYRVVKFPWKVLISDPFKKPEIIFLCWHTDYNWSWLAVAAGVAPYFSFQLIININSSASFQHSPSLWGLLWEIIKCGRMHCNE